MWRPLRQNFNISFNNSSKAITTVERCPSASTTQPRPTILPKKLGIGPRSFLPVSRQISAPKPVCNYSYSPKNASL